MQYNKGAPLLLIVLPLAFFSFLYYEHAKPSPEYSKFLSKVIKNQDCSKNFTQTLVYIMGIEESGVSYFTNLGNHPDGIFIHVKSKFQSEIQFTSTFNKHNATCEANHRLWSSGPIDQVLEAQEALPRLIDNMFRQYPTKKFLLAHRTFPFWDHHHYPDISSKIFKIFNEAGYNLKIIISYRDPKAASTFQIRSGYKHLIPPEGKSNSSDIYMAARSTETYLTLLSAQLQRICPQDFLVINYDRHVWDPEPGLQALSGFLGVTSESLKTVLPFKAPMDYRSSLSPAQENFLEDFFDESKQAQWDFVRTLAERPWLLRPDL